MKKEFKYLSLRITEIIALIILISLFLTTIYPLIPADPPPTLSRYSMGEYGDPGPFAFNARNKVLFAKWIIDAWPPKPS